MAIVAKLVGNKLVIEIDAELQNPEPSASGKTLLVASTHGSFKVPGLQVQGKQLTLNLSAYIKADKAAEE